MTILCKYVILQRITEEFMKRGRYVSMIDYNNHRGNFKSLQKWQKILVAICKWSVFGLSSIASAKEDGSHRKLPFPTHQQSFFSQILPDFWNYLHKKSVKANRQYLKLEKFLYCSTGVLSCLIILTASARQSAGSAALFSKVQSLQEKNSRWE